MHGRHGRERRERGVGGVHDVTEGAGQVQAEAGRCRWPAPTARRWRRSPDRTAARRPAPLTIQPAAVAPRRRSPADAEPERHAQRPRRGRPARRARRGRGWRPGRACRWRRRAPAAAPARARRTAAARAAARRRAAPRTSVRGASLTNRAGAACDGSTLQRPPPLMRILRPPSAVRSTRVTCAPASRAATAAISPAAPAPITTTCGVTRIPRLRRADHGTHRIVVTHEPRPHRCSSRPPTAGGCASTASRRRSCAAPCRRSCPARPPPTCWRRPRPRRRAGVGAVFTRLGENVADMAEAQRVTDHYLDGDRRSAGAAAWPASRRSSSTQLGLDVDPDRGLRQRPGHRPARRRGRQLLLGRHGAVVLRRRARSTW